MQQIGRVEMIEKIIKYEVKVSVPSSQASQHLKSLKTSSTRQSIKDKA